MAQRRPTSVPLRSLACVFRFVNALVADVTIATRITGEDTSVSNKHLDSNEVLKKIRRLAQSF